jgi:hypothetical protein
MSTTGETGKAVCRPSEARATELKRLIEEGRERWKVTNEGEELTYDEIRKIVRKLDFDRRCQYIEARLRPITRADAFFLEEYLSSLIPAKVDTTQEVLDGEKGEEATPTFSEVEPHRTGDG